MSARRVAKAATVRWPKLGHLQLGEEALDIAPGPGIDSVGFHTPEPAPPYLDVLMGLTVSRLSIDDVEQLVPYLQDWLAAVKGAAA